LGAIFKRLGATDSRLSWKRAPVPWAPSKQTSIEALKRYASVSHLTPAYLRDANSQQSSHDFRHPLTHLYTIPPAAANSQAL
jgi:hypothetical protein